MKSNQIYFDLLALETQLCRRKIEKTTETLTLNILLMPHDRTHTPSSNLPSSLYARVCKVETIFQFTG